MIEEVENSFEGKTRRKRKDVAGVRFFRGENSGRKRKRTSESVTPRVSPGESRSWGKRRTN